MSTASDMSTVAAMQRFCLLSEGPSAAESYSRTGSAANASQLLLPAPAMEAVAPSGSAASADLAASVTRSMGTTKGADEGCRSSDVEALLHARMRVLASQGMAGQPLPKINQVRPHSH